MRTEDTPAYEVSAAAFWIPVGSEVEAVEWSRGRMGAVHQDQDIMSSTIRNGERGVGEEKKSME